MRLVVVTLLFAGVLAGCRGAQPSATPASLPQPTLQDCIRGEPDRAARLDSIPADAPKLTPAEDLTPPVLHSDDWMPPVPMPGPVNTAGAEDSPFIAQDGQWLVFFFTPDASIPANRQLLDGVTGLYLSRRVGDTWGEPRRLWLQVPGELSLDGCGFLQGAFLWFCSARQGNIRDIDFWIATLVDGVPRSWVNAGQALNGDLGIGEMHLDASGSVIYFHGLDAEGDVDLYASRRLGDGWEPAQPLTALNTDVTEGWPFLTADGDQLWFTRTYQGSPAVLRSMRTADSWGEPELVVSSFAGEPTLDPAGNLYFVHHFVHDGEIIEADIYFAARR